MRPLTRRTFVSQMEVGGFAERGKYNPRYQVPIPGEGD
jgi:hypothetical protein